MNEKNGTKKSLKKVYLTLELDVFTDKDKIGVSDIFSFLQNNNFCMNIENSKVVFAKPKINIQYDTHSRVTFSDNTIVELWHNYKDEKWLRKKVAVHGYSPDGNHASILSVEKLN